MKNFENEKDGLGLPKDYATNLLKGESGHNYPHFVRTGKILPKKWYKNHENRIRNEEVMND